MALDLFASLKHVKVVADFSIVVQDARQQNTAEDEIGKQQHRVEGKCAKESPLLAILLKPAEDQSTDDRSGDGPETGSSKHNAQVLCLLVTPSEANYRIVSC